HPSMRGGKQGGRERRPTAAKQGRDSLVLFLGKQRADRRDQFRIITQRRDSRRPGKRDKGFTHTGRTPQCDTQGGKPVLRRQQRGDGNRDFIQLCRIGDGKDGGRGF